jgi:WD40 repeat protein
MDELRIVNKKKAEVKNPATALVKIDPVPRNIYNPKIFYCKLFKSLKGHQGDVLSVIISDGKIISGSQDKTIKVWDLNSGKLIYTLSGHNSGIYSLAVTDNKLLSCSADRTIKIWDLNTAELKFTLLGHNSHVYSLAVDKGRFASASIDKTIKIWDFATKKIIKVINTGEISALSICISNEKLVAGLSDGTIKIWDLSSARLLTSYRENDESITSVCISNGVLITGSKDKTVRIWNLENLDLINTLYGHKSPVWTVTVDTGRIISGSEDKTVKIWNLEDGKLIETLKEHSDWVSSVASGEGRIISASADSTLKVWTKVPVNNCNTIDLAYNDERSPFESDKEYEAKQNKILNAFYNKLVSYDYINIGKTELIAGEYSIENRNLPVRINIFCDKLIKFLKISRESMTSITIDRFQAQQICNSSSIYELYIRFFLVNQELKYELNIIFGSLKYSLDLKLQIIESHQRKKADIKKDRLNIPRGTNDIPWEYFNETLKNDCNTIDTTDTFKTPFEEQNDFEKRVRKKLINYQHIYIGKIELLAEQYNIEEQIFPVQINISCEKILNICQLAKDFPAKMNMDRYKAKEIYENSKVYNLFINFYQKDEQFFYDLSLIYQNLKYFIY